MLGSCSSGASSSGAGPSGGGISLPLTFLGDQPVGQDLRLPLALADAEGAAITTPPSSISVRVGPQGGELGSAVTIARHDAGIPRAYFPLRTRFDTEGQWRIVADTDLGSTELTVNAKQASLLPAVPGAGDLMPSLVTPTLDAPDGVDPVCTDETTCPLHTVSLDRALASGRPTVVLVSTPMYCQVAICGPVLDLLLDQATARAAQADFLHVEVYRRPPDLDLAPAVESLGLTYEPALFVVGADGVVRDRLDFTYDGDELAEVLDATFTEV